MVERQPSPDVLSYYGLAASEDSAHLQRTRVCGVAAVAERLVYSEEYCFYRSERSLYLLLHSDA